MRQIPIVRRACGWRPTRIGMSPVLAIALGAGAALGAGEVFHAAAGPAVSVPICVRDPHVVIVQSTHRMHLYDGESLVRSYPIDLGVESDGLILRAGDGRTPVGRFKIVSRNADSPNHRFLGIDYPNEAAVASGLRSGLISPGEAASIRKRACSPGRPAWGTSLGGGLGIHGRRVGWDWTGGCIAMSNAHVEELYAVLRVGDPVEILP